MTFPPLLFNSHKFEFCGLLAGIQNPSDRAPTSCGDHAPKFFVQEGHELHAPAEIRDGQHTAHFAFGCAQDFETPIRRFERDLQAARGLFGEKGDEEPSLRSYFNSSERIRFIQTLQFLD